MKVVFCFEGKTFKGPFEELLEDFKKRIGRYCPVEIIEAKQLKPQSRPGKHILLSPEGRSFTSEEFASKLEDYKDSGTKNLFFYVGGPEGFSADFKTRSDELISFSAMTFNHQLFRVMLLEQVYRAFTIINGEPYHK